MADVKKGNSVIWDNAPKIINDNDRFDPNIGENPARYLVNPGTVKAPGQHSPGQLRHARPYFVSGNVIFVFPVGVEGFSASGTVGVGIHHYIGANSVAAHRVHKEEGRITLDGTFPGATAQDAMVNCRNILRSDWPGAGLIYYAPGVFEMEQYVVPENWEFTHSADDRSHSIEYRITLLRVGEGKAVKDPHGTPARPNPTVTRRPPSSPARTFVARSGVQTFQQIAKAVYGSQTQWMRLVNLNGQLLGTKFGGIAQYQVPIYRWPIGTKVKY